MAGSQERGRERRKEMTAGAKVSARERARGRCWAAGERASRRCGWAALLGRTGASKHGRGHVAAGRSAGPSRRKEGKGGPRRKFLFLFFRNVNSISICLFHLKFYRSPKIVKKFV
jgi:hypothetical protein